MKTIFENQAILDSDRGVAAVATFLVAVGGLTSFSLFAALVSRMLV